MPLSTKEPQTTSDSDELYDRVYSDDVARGLQEAEKYANSQSDSSPTEASANDEVNRGEQAQANAIPSEVSKKSAAPQKKSFLSKLSTKKKFFAGFGFVGVGGILITIVGTFFPILKLDSVISTLSNKFGEIPEYALNQRVEYIATRWMAMKMMQSAYPGDNNLVFCKGGGILCSLGTTKYSAWFEEKLDAKFEKQGMRVTTTLNANGRTGLGGKATSFTLDLNQKSDIGEVSKLISKELDHKGARKYIRNLSKKVHGKNYLLRFISKGVLYKKYGIKRFNVLPEKTVKNVDELRAKMKASIIKGTLGKLSGRSAAYFACLSGGNSIGCQKTLSELSSSIDSDIQKAQESVNGSEEGSETRTKAERDLNRAIGRKETLDTAKSVINGDADSALSKIISKELIKKIAGPVAVAGAFDLVFKVVGAIDSRVLEMIMYDRQTQMYMSFVYNEEASPVVIRDQQRSSDVTMDQLQVASEMYDGIEESLLFQGINGLLSEGGTYSAKCQTENGEQTIQLAEGELLCPETKLVRDYTTLKQASWWQVTAELASWWNKSVGVIFDAVGDVMGAVAGPIWDVAKTLPGISQVSDFTSEKLGELMEWLLGQLFGTVDMGIGASGRNNYDVTAAALYETSNMGMSEGQDPDNATATPMGAGGMALTDRQLTALTEETQNRQNEDFESQTLYAKLFDTSQQRSVASQVLARMPTSSMSTISSLLKAPSLIISSLVAPASAQSPSMSTMTILKSFGTPVYGYAANDEALEADPAIYTKDFCEASSKARQESYTLEDGDLLYSYKKTDPCALEKVVAGMLATAAGDTEGENYIAEPTGSSSTSSAESTSTETETSSAIIDTPSKEGWSMPLPGAYISFGYRANGSKGVHKAIDFSYGSGKNDGKPVYAAHDGTVSKVRDMGACGWSTVITAEGVNGIWHAYQHMDPSVKVGDVVKRGQQIGAIGEFCGSGKHLHFSIETANRVSAYADSGASDTSRDPKDYLPL